MVHFPRGTCFRGLKALGVHAVYTHIRRRWSHGARRHATSGMTRAAALPISSGGLTPSTGSRAPECEKSAPGARMRLRIRRTVAMFL